MNRHIARALCVAAAGIALTSSSVAAGSAAGAAARTGPAAQTTAPATSGVVISAARNSSSAGTRRVIEVGGQFGPQPATRYVWVIYHMGKYSVVRISGHVTGATSGMVLKLYARRFPFRQAWHPIRQVTFSHSGTVPYSFKATPTLATRYKLELFQDSSSTVPLLVTRTTTVYVLAGWKVSPAAKCQRPVCRQIVHIRVFVPPSALRTEITKKVYSYFGLSLAPGTQPPVPRWLLRGAGSARITKARKVSTKEFDLRISYSFRIDQNHYYWQAAFCSKDTEAKDGINLPGHHSCGAVRISSKIRFLG